MSLYSFALFLHIVGAMGLFVSLGLEWTSLLNLRRAETTEQAQFAGQGLALVRRLGLISMVTILVAGVYMMATSWGGAPWIVVALLSLLLFPLLGVLGGRRMAVLGQVLGPKAQRGVLSPSLRQQLQHPLILASIQIRTALALGIVFLMTVKPDMAGSIIAIVVAVALGVASALPAWSRGRMEQRQEV